MQVYNKDVSNLENCKELTVEMTPCTELRGGEDVMFLEQIKSKFHWFSPGGAGGSGAVPGRWSMNEMSKKRGTELSKASELSTGLVEEEGWDQGWRNTGQKNAQPRQGMAVEGNGVGRGQQRDQGTGKQFSSVASARDSPVTTQAKQEQDLRILISSASGEEITPPPPQML